MRPPSRRAGSDPSRRSAARSDQTLPPFEQVAPIGSETAVPSTGDTAADALAAWRDADRREANMDPATDDWQDAFVETELAKTRYQDATEATEHEDG